MENNQGKSLQIILNDINGAAVTGSTNIFIHSLILDSRKVLPGTMFVALRGTQTDGHEYIDTAVNLGAAAILCEELPEVINPDVTYIKVPDSAEAMGFLASAFYDHPSQKLTLIGVTGTNGKTSVATFLFQLFRGLGYRCGLLSTVQNQVEEEVIPSTHTTPDSIALNQLLATMLKKGCSHVFMEVSSHAVVQHRITGLQFAGGIFTNITATNRNTSVRSIYSPLLGKQAKDIVRWIT